MRQKVDCTEWRTAHIRRWKKAQPFANPLNSKKALAILQVLANGKEWFRPDLYRAADLQKQLRAKYGSDLTDAKLFMGGFIDLRSVGYYDEKRMYHTFDKHHSELKRRDIIEFVEKNEPDRFVDGGWIFGEGWNVPGEYVLSFEPIRKHKKRTEMAITMVEYGAIEVFWRINDKGRQLLKKYNDSV